MVPVVGGGLTLSLELPAVATRGGSLHTDLYSFYGVLAVEFPMQLAPPSGGCM